MTRGHNIVEDGWAETSNSHPHIKPTTRLMHTQKVSKTLVFPLLNSMTPDGPADGRTDGWMDGRTKLLAELRVRTKNAEKYT